MSKIIGQLQAKLSQAKAELALARRVHKEAGIALEAAQKTLNESSKRIAELAGTPWTYGQIRHLEETLERELWAEGWSKLRAVRVRPYRFAREWSTAGFLRLTPKMVFVRENPHHRGSRIAHSEVHPDDLALIRAGHADRLPLVSEVAE